MSGVFEVFKVFGGYDKEQCIRIKIVERSRCTTIILPVTALFSANIPEDSRFELVEKLAFSTVNAFRTGNTLQKNYNASDSRLLPLDVDYDMDDTTRLRFKSGHDESGGLKTDASSYGLIFFCDSLRKSILERIDRTLEEIQNEHPNSLFVKLIVTTEKELQENLHTDKGTPIMGLETEYDVDRHPLLWFIESALNNREKMLKSKTKSDKKMLETKNKADEKMLEFKNKPDEKMLESKNMPDKKNVLKDVGKFVASAVTNTVDAVTGWFSEN